MNLRGTINDWLCTVTAILACLAASAGAEPAGKPNVVFVVADDMGWRDTGYQGSPHAKTPHLDDMAGKGVRFEYFYPGQQMCSPGRFALLTGRNPCRTGLHALGAMRPQEITLAKALKTIGYKTAHFGKWHLGSVQTSPAKMGFDEAIWKLNYYDLGASLQKGDSKEMVKLEGDTSVAVMKLAQEYIRKQVEAKQPFFVQVCFGSPHAPHMAADEFKAIYKDLPAKQQDFYGEISGLDAAVGNLRAELKKLGVDDNTIVWFVSDNGGITPQSQDPAGKGKMNVGVRTVSTMEWPARIKAPLRTSYPCGHIDMYPTILDIVGVTMPNQPVLDGTSLLPVLEGKSKERTKPMGFMFWRGGGKNNGFAKADFIKDTEGVWIDGKLRLSVGPDGKDARLHDIFADEKHATNLADKMPKDVTRMRKALDEWRMSVRASFDGKDFEREK
jgi:arylsulfatase A-like enzyme